MFINFMISKTLYCLLESLREEEKKRLADYIASPFFNKDKNIIRLYDFLQKKMKQKKMQNFDKRAVAKYVFPKLETATAERKVITLFKKIEGLILGFLATLKSEENSDEQVILLLNALNSRNIETVWKKVWQKYGAKQKRINNNIDNFRYKYLLAQNWHEFAIFDSKLKLNTNLQDVINEFETYYIAQMLQYISAALNSKQKSHLPIDLSMLSGILNRVEERKLDAKEPLINCYKSIVLLLQTQDKVFFDEVLLILTANTLQLAKEELIGIYTILINYCIVQYRQGQSLFGEHILTLYTQMLERDCLIKNHYLEYMHFKNILAVALRLKKVSWAKTFVHKYESRLNPNIRNDMKYYSEGLIFFQERKYEDAQFSFLQVNEFNFVFHLSKEVHLLRVFYLCDNPLLDSKLETFRSYLRQNKQLTLKTRNEYSNFYKKLKQLYRIKEQYEFLKNNPPKLKRIQKQAEKLLESLKTEESMRQKVWLYEQAQALYQKF